MFKKFAFLAICSILAPCFAHAACSRANLTRCLDSVCAINISTNPAARCQYCGTADAGTPTNTGIKSVSAVGTSTKFLVPDKELQGAPTDPGQRYVWATNQCVKRVNGCSPDDVSSAYDKLIEQSCTAAGINAQMSTLTAQISKSKTKRTCSDEISTCVQADKNCHIDFSGCGDDTTFTRIFSACATNDTGCDEYTTDIRNELVANRTSINLGKTSIMESIVKSYQDARENKLNSMRKICNNNAGRESCIAMICEQRMPNKCATESSNEKSMAADLCKFYDMACATLK
ncbi:MAG: hypothetical protein J5679_02325 [Alphaproteobacteria bacterium]|nr:hypothetical protein [Alphaproteobacteria bacterium]